MSNWEPPEKVAREDILKSSDAVLGRPSLELKQTEDIFRIEALGLEWDIGTMAYEPADGNVARGADGKKIGIFLLHGGSGDYKSMEPMAKTYAGKFGHKAVAMSFPGRHYLDDPSRDWPGDTIKADGTVRTPIWKRGEYVTRDQYDIIRDDKMRMRYGIRTLAKAKPGTMFHERMAAWPVAFEKGMVEALARHFPKDEYSVYVTGHSTGGPFVFMLSQRAPNVAGVIAIENSSFGYIASESNAWSGGLGKVAGYERVTKKKEGRKDPFDELYIRTWRDRARYAGPEALGQEGPTALMRLPWLMEEIFDWWDKTKMRPQFKVEYIITHKVMDSQIKAAKVAAARLKLNEAETQALVDHYIGLSHPLEGPGTRPVPPVLFIIAKDSRDHTPDVYNEVILPMFAKMDRAPKVRLVQFGAGVHTYNKSEEGLPLGIVPTAAELYHEAITKGYFVV